MDGLTSNPLQRTLLDQPVLKAADTEKHSDSDEGQTPIVFRIVKSKICYTMAGTFKALVSLIFRPGEQKLFYDRLKCYCNTNLGL